MKLLLLPVMKLTLDSVIIDKTEQRTFRCNDYFQHYTAQLGGYSKCNNTRVLRHTTTRKCDKT